jgi:hypothetical protein
VKTFTQWQGFTYVSNVPVAGDTMDAGVDKSVIVITPCAAPTVPSLS